jgi:D-sedoheptulose 7-phosphate isomerase
MIRAPMIEQRIQQHFFDSADLKYQTAETLARPIADAAGAVIDTLTAGGKVLVWGADGAAALGRHFASSFVGRFERERPPLPALPLDGDAMGLKQLHAWGHPGDALLLIADGSGAAGHGPALVEAAHGKDMTVIALCGTADASLRAGLSETDVNVTVPHDRSARVLELHLLVLHCVCDAVDLQLMGEQDP